MLYLSSLLQTTPIYQAAADRLSAALVSHQIPFRFLTGAKDIWLRDFMPVQIRDGTFVSFRYDPGYLQNTPELKTDYEKDIAPQLSLSATCSSINLDGGNVVFSPSRARVVISDRVLRENPAYAPQELVKALEEQLMAQVILIPSLPSDMTGHADGMVRFVDENTVVGNRVPSKYGLEQRIKWALRACHIEVIDFPYFFSPKDSAVGCYLNFLETDTCIFLPVFEAPMDERAVAQAQDIFSKPVVPVCINEIATQGGVLNCISWETPSGFMDCFPGTNPVE